MEEKNCKEPWKLWIVNMWISYFEKWVVILEWTHSDGQWWLLFVPDSPLKSDGENFSEEYWLRLGCSNTHCVHILRQSIHRLLPHVSNFGNCPICIKSICFVPLYEFQMIFTLGGNIKKCDKNHTRCLYVMTWVVRKELYLLFYLKCIGCIT